MLKKSKYTYVELFTGTGGMHLGFELAGLRTVAAIDIDKNSCETFYLNRKKLIDKKRITFLREMDITNARKVNRGTLFKNVKNIQLDVLAGGPPCQGMSLAGPRNIDDPRNKLFKHYVRILSDSKPKVFVFENVKGLNSGISYTNLLEHIEDCLSDSGSGYWVESKILKADDFGVPQKRERIFIIGISKSFFKSKEPIEQFYKSLIIKGKQIRKELKDSDSRKTTVEDAIGDLRINTKTTREVTCYSSEPVCKYQRVMRRGYNGYLKIPKNHKPMGHTDSIRLRFALIDEGKGLKSLYKKLKDLGVNSKSFEDGCDFDDKNIIAINYRDLIRKYEINMDKVKVQRIIPNKIYFQRHRKPERSGQCHTVTCHVEDEVINPYEARIVTPREAARLQSFPDWYEFYGPSIVFHGKKECSQTEQIGNAVPPLLAYAIAKAIKEVFLNDKQGSKIDLRNDWKPINNQK